MYYFDHFLSSTVTVNKVYTFSKNLITCWLKMEFAVRTSHSICLYTAGKLDFD